MPCCARLLMLATLCGGQTLDEPNVWSWVLGASGESCHQACVAHGGACSEATLWEHNVNVSTSAAVASVVHTLGFECASTNPSSTLATQEEHNSAPLFEVGSAPQACWYTVDQTAADENCSAAPGQEYARICACGRAPPRTPSHGRLIVVGACILSVITFLALGMILRKRCDLSFEDDDLIQMGDSMIESPILWLMRSVNEAAATGLFYQSVSKEQFEVSRVELLKSKELTRATTTCLASILERGENPMGSVELPADLDAEDRKAKDHLREFVHELCRTAPWAEVCAIGDAEAGKGYLQVVPVWHGASESTIDSIRDAGFACLAAETGTDPGWHANGCYNAAEAQLAALYATSYPFEKVSNDRDEFVVLLSAAVLDEVYCITPGRADYPSGPLPPEAPEQCRFYGCTIQAPATTHVAGVDGKTLLGTAPDRAAYVEIVSSQHAQLLPLAKVFFKRRGPSAIPRSVPSGRGWVTACASRGVSGRSSSSATLPKAPARQPLLGAELASRSASSG